MINPVIGNGTLGNQTEAGESLEILIHRVGCRIHIVNRCLGIEPIVPIALQACVDLKAWGSTMNPRINRRLIDHILRGEIGKPAQPGCGEHLDAGFSPPKYLLDPHSGRVHCVRRWPPGQSDL